MTIKELLDKYDGQYVDYEVYCRVGKIGHSRIFHTDTIEEILEGGYRDTWEILDYELMNEQDYDTSVLANASPEADFAEWYGDKEAKLLCILVSEDNE